MSTIIDKKIIDQIIAADGKLYEDELPVIRIVEYLDMAGNTAWGVTWQFQDPTAYLRSLYCRNPKIIFDKVEHESYPETLEDQRQKTPWAVLCRTHGRVYLTHREYDAQMSAPNDIWRCPYDSLPAVWDDDSYEEYLDDREAAL